MHHDTDSVQLDLTRSAAVDLPVAELPADSRDRLPELLEAAATWLLELDPAGIIRYASHALPTTTRELMHDTPLSSWIVPADRAQLQRQLEAVHQTGHAASFGTALSDAPGRRMSLTLHGLRSGGGGPTLLAQLSERRGALEPVEEQRQLESRIEEHRRSESLGALAGGVAHDFNNLLAAMMGNASLLREQCDPTSPGHEMAVEIEQAARRASQLCDQMLDYAGLSPLHPSEACLSQVCDAVLPRLRRGLPPQVRLICDLPRDVPSIRCDPALVERVASALLHNAVEALPAEGGTVRLRTRTAVLGTTELMLARLDRYLPSGQYAVLEVEDDGCGMDAETCQRIFDPYFSTKFVGRGLSLAAVHGIVRTHSGGIRVRSKPQDGTTVEVYFPIESRLLKVTREVPVVDGPAGVRRNQSSATEILLALPDPFLAQETAQQLSTSGHAVARVDHGGAALREFSRDPTRFSALCIDLSLPEVHGHELLTAVRSRSRSLPVIVCSHLPVAELQRLFADDERVFFVRKPTAAPQLVALVHRLLTG